MVFLIYLLGVIVSLYISIIGTKMCMKKCHTEVFAPASYVGVVAWSILLSWLGAVIGLFLILAGLEDD